MKKIISTLFWLIAITFIIIVLFFTLIACSNNKKKDIVSTCFAGYDFSRAVAGDNMSSTMLLEPGEELHDYSPSVGDIEAILESKVFIYIGGESDEEWVEKQIIPFINKKKTKVINMMDVVKEEGNIYYEEDPEKDTVSDEYDEHIWTSIKNAKILVNKICDTLIEIDSDNRNSYIENRDKYLSSLDECDTSIKDIVSTSPKDILVFADRFPLLYFVKEYNLKYDAAFKGCETSKEANPKTIERLIKTIKDNDLSAIFVIELSEAKIADTIKKECSKSNRTINVYTFYTMHNISSKDYKNKITYIDLMNRNIDVLKNALK